MDAVTAELPAQIAAGSAAASALRMRLPSLLPQLWPPPDHPFLQQGITATLSSAYSGLCNLINDSCIEGLSVLGGCCQALAAGRHVVLYC